MHAIRQCKQRPGDMNLKEARRSPEGGLEKREGGMRRKSAKDNLMQHLLGHAGLSVSEDALYSVFSAVRPPQPPWLKPRVGHL